MGNGSENNVKITICSFKEIEKSPIMFYLMNMKINQLYSNSSTLSCVYFAVYTWALVCKSLTPLISVLVFWSCNSFCTSDNFVHRIILYAIKTFCNTFCLLAGIPSNYTIKIKENSVQNLRCWTLWRIFMLVLRWHYCTRLSCRCRKIQIWHIIDHWLRSL